MVNIVHLWAGLVMVGVVVQVTTLVCMATATSTATSTWMLPRPQPQNHHPTNIYHYQSRMRKNRWYNSFKFSLGGQQRQEYRTLLLLSRGGGVSGVPSDGGDEETDEDEDDAEEEQVSDTVVADAGNSSVDTVTETEEEEDDVENDKDDDDEAEEDVDAVNESDSSETTIESNSIQKYDDPYVPNSMSNMYISIAVMILGRKVDLLSPMMVRITRFIFISYVLLHLGFLTYVRIQAKMINNRTPIQLPTNPLISTLINNQLGGGTDASSSLSSGSGMMKSLASSFLSSSTTVLEYDLKQSRNMQNGLLFNMLFMWFLHFKMGQVQPLLINTFNGAISMVYSPLFQVYILGRNLERPFVINAAPKPPAANSTDEKDDDDDDDDDVGESSSEGTDVSTKSKEENDDDVEDDEDDDDEVE